MKKQAIIGAVCTGLLVVVLGVALWPRMPRGEFQTERGLIYYFKDGVVAIDKSHSPVEYYVYANHPTDNKIEHVEIIDDGLEITGPGIIKGPGESTNAKMTLGHSAPPQPGTVRVIDNHGDWSEVRYVTIDSDNIRNFVKQRDWDASVRTLWEG